MTVVSWGGSSVAIEGPDDVVADVVEQLPPFYARSGTASAVAGIETDQGLATLHLEEEGMGLTMAHGPEFYKAAASRIELVLVDRLPDLVAVHAGVVGVADGVILIPGTSMSGKSTLTRELIDNGYTYWSDEFALLDAQGQVHAYPRAMTMRTLSGSVRHVPERHASPSDVAPARLVALLRYDRRGWDARDLTPGETAMGLIDNCVSVRRDRERALQAVAALARRAPGLQGTRGEASETIDRLTGPSDRASHGRWA